jgi:hypothetical protein
LISLLIAGLGLLEGAPNSDSRKGKVASCMYLFWNAPCLNQDTAGTQGLGGGFFRFSRELLD